MYDFQLMICAIIYLLEKTSVASMINSLEKKKDWKVKFVPQHLQATMEALHSSEVHRADLCHYTEIPPEYFPTVQIEADSEQSPLKAQQQSKQLNKSSLVHPKIPTGTILSASALQLILALAHKGVKKTPTKYKSNLHENENSTTKPSHTTITAKTPKPP